MKDIIVCKVPVTESCPSGVKIVVPSPKVSMATALKTIPEDTLEYYIEHRDNVPQDRYFRNAWQVADQKLAVDMAKAKAVHIEKLRVVRNEKLKELDTAYLQALESKDEEKQAAIQAKKKRLRDMPTDAAFNAVGTPSELKSLIPDYLK